MRAFLLLLSLAALAQEVPRLNQAKVTRKDSPAPEPGAETQIVPSLVEGLTSREDWYKKRRPELLAYWTRILGKLEPAPNERQFVGDVTKAIIREKTDNGKYTRILLDLPVETDFLQHAVLLVPKGPGPFPAVVCWVSTTPDFTEIEKWWGQWLAERGYVVLGSWAFIRQYRDDSTFRTGAVDMLYERYGHWLPMGKMVWDARREAEYLRSLKQVDPQRIGFMGFSLSGKSAVYVGAFAPEFRAVVAFDPGLPINAGTNWWPPWYLDWLRLFPDIPTGQHTVLSLLNPDPNRPGFEHDHHELLALAAPRPFLLIGGSGHCDECGNDSDDRRSLAYFHRAREVYQLVGVPERIQFALTSDGHSANGPAIDPAWQGFIEKWLKR